MKMTFYRHNVYQRTSTIV